MLKTTEILSAEAAAGSDTSDGELDKFDWSNPSAFFDQVNLPAPSSFPTADEVRRDSRQRAVQVLHDWETLSKIVERHEEKIQNRWRQKTKQKRRQVLLAAWPNMSKTHRPDLAAWKRRSIEQSREAYLWPAINLEDLEQPRPLLLLLNARGRHHPYEFAQADFDATQFGQATGAIRTAFLNLHTVMFTGRTTPETYGEVIAWDDNDDAFEWCTEGKGFHPGHGLLVLEIQQRLYHFLLECCRQLLHDIDWGSIIGDYPVQPEPAIKDEGDWHSLAGIAADAPYRLPGKLDLASIEEILGAKRSAAEDHILALREDPGYFAEIANDYREHRSELIPDTNGRRHPSLTSRSHTLFWNRVLQNVVAEAYFSLEIWGTLHAAVAGLRRLHSETSQYISPEKDLPTELYEGLVNLRFFLQQLSKGPINQLEMVAPASPALRTLFAREPQEYGTTLMRISVKTHVSMTKSQAELLWILRSLWSGPQMIQLAGQKTLMDEFERLVQSDPKNKDLISNRVAFIVSDLSVITECLYQIELFHPWAATFETDFANRADEVQREYMRLTGGWQNFLKSFEGTSLGDLGAPNDGRFLYPVERRRNRENVDLLRSAERRLDVFWTGVDTHLPVKRGMTRTDAVYHLLTKIKGLIQRTPPWMEPIKQPPKSKVLEKSLADLHFELEFRTEKTLEPSTQPPPPKRKVKTQGRPAPSDHPEYTQPVQQQDAQPAFKVDKRALKVFSTLFFQPSQTAQPGEIMWNDFLHAMGSTAFAIEKLYGSVWQFTPRNLDVERSIQFHEPHPVAKIPFRVARRFGRRLNRTYGWHGGMFTVA